MSALLRTLQTKVEPEKIQIQQKEMQKKQLKKAAARERGSQQHRSASKLTLLMPALTKLLAEKRARSWDVAQDISFSANSTLACERGGGVDGLRHAKKHKRQEKEQKKQRSYKQQITRSVTKGRQR
jgi:hypothetical protein